MVHMSRILSDEVNGHVGKKVQVEGWIHKKRLLGGLNFINIRDRSGLVQAVIEDKDEVEKLRGMQIGTVVKVTGVVEKEERAPAPAPTRSPTLFWRVVLMQWPSTLVNSARH